MKARHQRLLFFTIMLAISGSALAVFLNRIEDNIIYFYSPTDIITTPPPSIKFIRAGGLVVEGSVKIVEENAEFIITDGAQQITVKYVGALPSLFRAGQGIIAEGFFKEGVMKADKILAKHDEKYMPPEIAKSLKKTNHWREMK